MKRLVVALVAIAAFVAVSVPAFRHLREQPPPPEPALRLAFTTPPGLDPGFADETLDAAISPGETEVVFVATRDETAATAAETAGERQLWRRALDADSAQPVPGTIGAQQPAWKRTGQVIAFFADGQLKQVTLDDGIVHDLAEASSAHGATWLDDGSLLYATGAGPIRRLLAGQSSEATTLRDDDVAHVFPSAADGTAEFVYVAVRGDGRRVARLVTTAGEQELTTTAGHAVMVGSHLLHVRDGVLLAYERDRESGELSPRGVPLGLNVGVSSTGRALFAASPRLLLYAPALPRAMTVAWLDFSGRRVGTAADAGDFWQVRLSPDDRQVALASMDPLLRALDIATVPADGSASVQRLTLALAADTDPVWSPDGGRILFRSMEGGTANLFARPIGQRAETSAIVLESDLDETPTDWFGDQILFQARGRNGADVMVLHTRTGHYGPIADSAFNETDGRWSPDGRWMAYVSDESGRPDIYARRPDATRLRVSFAGGRRPRWTRDGRSILFLRGSQIMRTDVTADGAAFTPAHALFAVPGIRDFDVAHGSDRLIALLPVETGARPGISAVLNWMSLVLQRTPNSDTAGVQRGEASEAISHRDHQGQRSSVDLCFSFSLCEIVSVRSGSSVGERPSPS